MGAAGGLLLAITCIAIVAIALGVAIAARPGPRASWPVLIARGVAVTIAAACFLLASVHQLAGVLP